MRYQCQFRLYRRPFRQPVITNHGHWVVREGMILCLVDEAGQVGWGEIAPLPWFGSETLEQALAFCHQLPTVLTEDLVFAIPDALPCCQFAFESALEGINEAAITKIKASGRNQTVDRAILTAENSKLQPQNSDIEAVNSVIEVENSTLRPQNSNIEAQNPTLRDQSSMIAVQNSELRPQNSEHQAQNSTLRDQSSMIAVQNSELRDQSSDIEAQNPTLRDQSSMIAVQNSELRPPNSEHQAQNSTLRDQSSEHQAQNSTLFPSSLTPHASRPYSALLPAGDNALQAWKAFWEEGFRTFKWKVGVYPIATELESLHRLAQNLPKTAKLRLDANGGLTLNDAIQWLQACDAIAVNPTLFVALEYMEQPLNVSQFQAMQDLSQRYRTPIALDESVATLQQLQTCYENGWRGIFVIKPAIVGSPSRLRQFCQKHSIDAVFSSAFETAIGRQAGLKLAIALGNPDRAMGYGTTHWLDDDLSDVKRC